ncbi:unnamed protein product [Mytilus coruscus]|uniref:Uncharacterized protein n=1 Tax=Mytilus coruscus TaxID=42192 RepID=A0A6J8EAK0_MYTCO|nr:unnamed protein product [Mytilus coruscus]
MAEAKITESYIAERCSMKPKTYCKPEYVYLQELVFPNDIIFPSVYWTQQALKQFETFEILMSPVDNDLQEFKTVSSWLQSVMGLPQLIVVRYGCKTEHLSDLGFFKKVKFEEIKPLENQYVYIDDDLKDVVTPFAVAYLIRTTRSGGKCRLSQQTRVLLSKAKLKTDTDHVVFIIENTRFSDTYSSTDLMDIGREIEQIFQLDENTTFKNIFHESDDELFVRLGFIMQSHILNGIKILSEMLDSITAESAKGKLVECKTITEQSSAVKIVNGITNIPTKEMKYEQMKQFRKFLKEEIDNRSNNLELHTWRILSKRNSLIHAFGFVGGTVRFFLTKANDEHHVKEYFDKYMKTRVLNMNVHKWEPNAKVKNFAFEQGSKIDISETSRITKNDKPQYGSLGMFFQNKQKGRLFFTTCAHVVAEGSIEDLRGRNVYKWGATTNFTDGTVCDFIAPNDGFLEIGIQSQNVFAKKGDSGSLVCLNITELDRYAVLVIVDAVEEIKTTIIGGQNIELCPVAEQSIPIYSKANQHLCCSSNYANRRSRSPTRRERESRKRQKALSPNCIKE